MRKFIYRDNSDEGRVIFEYKTDDILKAYAAFEEELGKNPKDLTHIGCSIEKL